MKDGAKCHGQGRAGPDRVEPGKSLALGCVVRPTGIEPVSRASETLILSIELRAPTTEL